MSLYFKTLVTLFICCILTIAFTYDGMSQSYKYGGNSNTPSVEKSFPYAVNDSLPSGFPNIETQIYNDPMQGYNFISPLKHLNHYLIICDNYSTPVFYRKVPWGASDFKVQPTGMLTYFSNRYRCFYGMDEKFNVIDTFSCKGDYAGSADMHELRVQNNGHYFIMAYDPQIVNMDTVVPGGHHAAVVSGLIIQEIDANDSVVFQWRSWDHFKITDAHSWVNLQDSIIDYVHGNSIEIESDTSILISCRNMNEITKIDRRTGEIIWRLNGENNQFTFINDTLRFVYQHSIRYMPDSSRLSIFDNGLGHPPFPFSSALEYEIDEDSMTAILIQRLYKSPKIFCSFMGHAQRHQNGCTTIGWGHVDTNYTPGYTYMPAITEFKPDSSVALEISFPHSSYRAFKFDWKTTALVPGKNELIFDSVPVNDSLSLTVYITNNTDSTMLINRILHHDVYFSCNINAPISINSLDSIPVIFSFKPEEDNIYNEIYTFCSDTYKNEINQRIACQVRLSGNTITPGFTGELTGVKGFVSVYPNPADNQINFRLSSVDVSYSILIYDMFGRKMDEPDILDRQLMTEVDVTDYTSGIYIVVLQSENTIIDSHKFVVNH